MIDAESRLEILRSLAEHDGWVIYFNKLADEVGRAATACTPFHEDHAKWAFDAGRARGLQEAAELLKTLMSIAKKEAEKGKNES